MGSGEAWPVSEDLFFVGLENSSLVQMCDPHEGCAIVRRYAGRIHPTERKTGLCSNAKLLMSNGDFARGDLATGDTKIRGVQICGT